MRVILSTALMIAVTVGSLAAHDMFLKPFNFFVKSGEEARVRVLNGTFTKSENAVARNRLRDLSVVSPSAGRQRQDTASWSDNGDTSVFVFRTAAAGTYIVGASTLPRSIRLDAKQFNEYLASDGIPDMLAVRRKAGDLAKPSHERYSKHVKTLIQVGELRTRDFSTVLGYPAELVPLDNPYDVKSRGSLRVRALVDGATVANQLIVAGGRTVTGARLLAQSARSDADGVARVRITAPGYWYVKFIHMVPVTGDSVNYESKWATLTFQIR